MKQELIKSLDETYEEYLSDESKMKGYADTISFPESREDIAEIVRQMRAKGSCITVQGGKTGICGAAVPLGGHVMNLSHMAKAEALRKTEDGYLIKVQTGLPLSELRRMVSAKDFDTHGWDAESLSALEEFRNDIDYFWPPDPTETSAEIGGMLGTNAQSITDFRYGRLKEYVEEIELIDCCGNLITTKDIDRYIGSEGMYGIFTSAVLRLVRRPQEMWGICFFFEEKIKLLHFAEEVLQLPKRKTASVAAVEYIGHMALEYIRRLKQVASKLQELPDIHEKIVGVIYVELHGDTEDEMALLAEELMELAKKYDNDVNSTWALTGETGIEKMKLLRHSVPESVNMEIKRRSMIEPRITKLSTDLTTGYTFSEDVLFYERKASAEGLEIVVFGHVPENRIHVNIISHSYDEYKTGKDLLESWYRRALESGGTVFREHGIGKVKKELFNKVAGEDVRERIATNKTALDPEYLFNPGNILKRT